MTAIICPFSPSISATSLFSLMVSAETIRENKEVALIDGENGQIMAVMRVTEKYYPDKTLECSRVFRTTDNAHPGVEKVMKQGDVNLSGPVKVINEGEFPSLEIHLRL